MASEYDLLRAVVGEEAEKMVGAHSEVFIVSKSSSVPFPASPPINMSGTSLGDVTPEQMSSTSGGSDSDDEVPRMYALKRQLIRNPEDGDERTYKELRIFIELKRLRNSGMSPNFVNIEAWFQYQPPLLFPTKYYHDSTDQFGLYVLEYAHRDLTHYSSLSVRRYRCMLFQLLWGLFIAQKELQFVHHDIHVKNILLQPLPSGVDGLVFRLEQEHLPIGKQGSGEEMVWCAPYFVVKITDFGLSSTRSETTTTDIDKAMNELKRVKVSWESEDAEEDGESVSDRLGGCTHDTHTLKEAQRLLKALRREAAKPGCSAGRLLCHPFFDPLRIKSMPCGCERVWRFSSRGMRGSFPGVCEEHGKGGAANGGAANGGAANGGAVHSPKPERGAMVEEGRGAAKVPSSLANGDVNGGSSITDAILVLDDADDEQTEDLDEDIDILIVQQSEPVRSEAASGGRVEVAVGELKREGMVRKDLRILLTSVNKRWFADATKRKRACPVRFGDSVKWSAKSRKRHRAPSADDVMDMELEDGVEPNGTKESDERPGHEARGGLRTRSKSARKRTRRRLPEASRRASRSASKRWKHRARFKEAPLGERANGVVADQAGRRAAFVTAMRRVIGNDSA